MKNVENFEAKKKHELQIMLYLTQLTDKHFKYFERLPETMKLNLFNFSPK